MAIALEELLLPAQGRAGDEWDRMPDPEAGPTTAAIGTRS